jgi:hypothetical protein
VALAGEQLGEQPADPLADLVADLADGLDGLTGGVGPGESRTAAIPGPTTAATRNAVPVNSASALRPRAAVTSWRA